MLSSLAEIGSEPTILHLHGFRVPFYSEILAECGRQKRFPIFIVGHGMSTVPTSEMAGLHRPLTYACLLVEHWKLSRLLSHVDVISAQSEYARSELRKIFRGRTELLTMGCDFDFWVPVPTAGQKRVVQSALGIPQARTVFLATGNFVPLKQFDKLLDVFGRLGKRQDYVLLIAGHGDQANTDRLEALSRSLVGGGKAVLHPYVTGEQLRNLYWAADVYASVSTSEGASVSVMKAMACGLPVLATPVGETSERMKRHGVGRFVPVFNYDEWRVAIEEILEKGRPKPLDREVACEAYHWPRIAKRFIAVYEDLLRGYSKSRAGSHV
jgi:glycosyltransferase involved in cell wall biosynthesis